MTDPQQVDVAHGRTARQRIAPPLLCAVVSVEVVRHRDHSLMLVVHEHAGTAREARAIHDPRMLVVALAQFHDAASVEQDGLEEAVPAIEVAWCEAAGATGIIDAHANQSERQVLHIDWSAVAHQLVRCAGLPPRLVRIHPQVRGSMRRGIRVGIDRHVDKLSGRNDRHANECAGRCDAQGACDTKHGASIAAVRSSAIYRRKLRLGQPAESTSSTASAVKPTFSRPNCVAAASTPLPARPGLDRRQ